MSDTVLVRSMNPTVLVKALNEVTTLISREQGPAGPAGPAVTQTKGITLAEPQANENVTIVYTVEEIELRRLNALVAGTVGSSITYTVKFGPDRNGPGTEVKTGGITVSALSTGVVTDALDNSTIPANSFVWFQTTAKVGAVDQFHLTLTY